MLQAILFVALHAHEFLPFYKFSVETGSYQNCFKLKIKQQLSTSFSKLLNISHSTSNLNHLSSLQSELKKTITFSNKLLIKLDTYIQNDKTVNENIKDQASLFNKESDDFIWFVIYDDVKDSANETTSDLNNNVFQLENNKENILVNS